MNRLRLSILLSLLTLTSAAAFAGVPVVDDVDPEQGFTDEPTEITINGTGFDPSARVSLLAGGPRTAARVDLGGVAHTIGAADGYAYVVDRSEFLRVFDVRDPSSPREVASVDVGELGIITKIEVEGGVLFAAGSIGISIFDVSDPTRPQLLNHIPEDVSLWGSFALQGGYAYRYRFPDGVLIIDVSNPLQPDVVAELPGYFSPAVADEYLFVTDGRSIYAFDVRNPAHPEICGTYEAGTAVGALFVSGTTLVFHDPFIDSPLHVLDVSDPTSMQLGGRAGLSADDHRLVLSNSIAAVVEGTGIGHFHGRGEVRLYDLRDTDTPALTYRDGGWSWHSVGVALPFFYYFFSMAIDERFLYAPYKNGFQVVDLDLPWSQTRSYGPARGVAATGDHVFSVSDESFRVLDLADPGMPVELGRLETEGSRRDVVVSGNYAYVIGETEPGLEIIDVSDPADPRLVGTASVPVRHTLGVAVAGDYAYAAGGGLSIFDVTDRANPVRTGGLVFGGFESGQKPTPRRGLAIDGEFAYVVTYPGDDVFYVVNVSDPENPRLASSLRLTGRAYYHAVAVADGFAYIAAEHALEVIDVRDPVDPQVVGSFDVGDSWAVDLSVDGDTVYLAATSTSAKYHHSSLGGGSTVLLEIDVSEPTEPTLVARYFGAGLAMDLAVANGRAHLASCRSRTITFNPRTEDVASPSAGRVDATVPDGMLPGVYDVAVVNSPDEVATAANGFRACARREFSAALTPVGDFQPPLVIAGPVPWRLELNGENEFFEPAPRHDAQLLLPDLPANLESRVRPGDGSGKMAVKLRLWPRLDTGEVVLTGDDADEVQSLWNEARETSGFSLQRHDDRSYGDLGIGMTRTPAGILAQWHPLGGSPGGPPSVGQAPVRYRYEFSGDGLLLGVHARGPGVDLIFETVGQDTQSCEMTHAVSYSETLVSICEELGSQYPEYVFDCR